MPPSHAIKYYIKLQHGVALLKAALCRSSLLENKEIKRQIQELFNNGQILPNLLLCGSAIALVPKEEWHKENVTSSSVSSQKIHGRQPSSHDKDCLNSW